MIGKTTIIFCLVATMLLAIHAQPNPIDRNMCRRLNARCEACARRLGRNDPGVIATNAQCRNQMGAAWRPITRCQLVRALCELTLVGCDKYTCQNMQRVLRAAA